MPHTLALLFASVSLALAVSGPRASGQVFVVDASGGPGSHYTDLPTAVAAVPSGSVLRVRPGTYLPFRVANKSLIVIGEDAATVVIDFDGELVIGPTAVTEVVRLRRLTLRTPAFGASAYLRIEGALGAVVLQDVHLEPTLHGLLLGSDRCLVSDSPNVHLLDCTMSADPNPLLGGPSVARFAITRSRVEIRGGSYTAHRGIQGSFGVTGPAGAAFGVVDASLVLVDAQVLGGNGAPGHDLYPFHGGAPGGRGGAAIELHGSSSLELWGRVGLVVRGGDGGAPSPNVFPGADGGDGIVVGARAVVLGVSPQGGAAGDALHLPGLPFRPSGGVLFHDPSSAGPLASFRGTPTIGATVYFELLAPAGDFALLLLGFEVLHFDLGPAILGDLFTIPIVSTPAQIVPGGGRLAVPLFVGDLLPPGLALCGQFLTLHLPSGELRLSNSVLAPE